MPSNLAECAAAAHAVDCAPGMLRVAMVGRLGPDVDRLALAAEFSAAAASTDTTAGQRMCGLLHIYPKHIVHYLEASGEDMKRMVLLTHAQQASGMLDSVRVMLCTDARELFFADYSTEILQLAGGQTMEYRPSDALEQVVAEACLLLYQIGDLFRARLPEVCGLFSLVSSDTSCCPL